ncbi:MAG: hypothetical protein JO354_04775 [Verrucomicrobia bacterium]|nr:hypothetical protein [Verrucomicrobiota bacterium]
MKKLVLVAAVAMGFMMLGAPKSEARVFVNIGIGLPVFYPYPAYYGYYPYPYPTYYPTVYYGAVYRPYYWWHGRRVYYRRRW